MTIQAARERGSRKRSFGLIGFGLVVVLLSAVTWRATSLRGLPDIGDPFDMAAFGTITIPDDENAWFFYRKASEKLGKEPDSASGVSLHRENDPIIKAWLEANRESFRLWVEGSKRDRGVYIQPKDMSFDTLLPAVQNLRSLARMGLYEGALREAAGDQAGAWEIYRAGLRCSRHCGTNGAFIERLVGIAIHSMYASRISTWASNPSLDVKLLRTALADVQAAEKLTPLTSGCLKLEYMAIVAALRSHPERYVEPLISNPSLVRPSSSAFPNKSSPVVLVRLSEIITREPERSKRVVRLIFDNWLKYSDLPPSERKDRERTFGTSSLTLYESRGSQSHEVMPLDEIASWTETSTYAKMLTPSYQTVSKAISRDEATAAALLVHLAERLAVRETGKVPASVADLVGPYLQEIPNGYIPMVGPPAP